jgi:flagellar hook-length control protein FliK
MQVSQSPASQTPPRKSTAAPIVLLPNIVQLLQPSPQAQTQREQTVERQRAEQQRRQREYHTALSAASQATRPSDVLIHAERNMLPGSQSAERAQSHDQALEHATQNQRGFRQALADAGARGIGPRATPDALLGSNTIAPSRGASAATELTAAHKPAGSEPGPAAAGSGRSAPTPLPTATLGATRMVPAPAPSAAAAASAAPAPAAALGVSTARLSNVTTTTTATSAPTVSGPRTNSVAASATPSVQFARVARRDTAAPQTGPAPDTDGSFEPNIERILRLVQTRIGKDRSVTTLRLDPPELGTLRIHLDLRQNQLTLQVDTQTPTARRLLEEQLDTLRRNLEAAGIHLERIEIRSPLAATDTPNPDTPPQPNVPQDGRQDTQDPEHNAPHSDARQEPPPSAAPPPVQTTGDPLVPAAEPLVNVLA